MRGRQGLFLIVAALAGSGLFVACLLLIRTPSIVERIMGPGVDFAGFLVVEGTPDECPMPPASFQESDLFGTWTAGNDERLGTLVLDERGLYRQSIYIQDPPFSFQGDWERWWLEHRDDAPPLVHLENMRLCLYDLSSSCDPPPGKDSLYDYCGNVVPVQGEGVLLVSGVLPQFEQPPGGLILLPLTSDPDTGGFTYRLKP